MRRPVILALTIALAGCVAVGTQVKEGQLAQFQKDASTYQDVIDKLGRPNSSSIISDGTRIACYTFIQSTARPESFIPIVGAFAGGADSHTDMTCLTFDNRGVLKSYSSTNSQNGVGYGFESGNSPAHDRVSAEPKHAIREDSY